MKQPAILVTTCLLLAGPLAAQDLIYSNSGTEACLASADGQATPEICIGVSAGACMRDTPGGESTIGTGACLEQERLYWDDRLNAAYKPLMARSKGIDAEMAEIGATVMSQEETLRNMQRAWIAFRDAACDFEWSQWGGGTGSGPATVHCLMMHTGKQALILEQYLAQ